LNARAKPFYTENLNQLNLYLNHLLMVQTYNFLLIEDLVQETGLLEVHAQLELTIVFWYVNY